jgi:large conductance mechanosensitive channel
MPIPVEPVRAAGSLLNEFRAFVVRGPMVELAVGVVAGAAFSRLIDALVKNVFMKVLEYVLPDARSYEAWVVGNVEVGKFLAELLNFVVVGFALFFVIVKVGGLLTRKRQQEADAADPAGGAKPVAGAKPAPKAPPPVPADVVLLTEIRDLLRQQQHLLQSRATSPTPTFGFKTGDDERLF